MLRGKFRKLNNAEKARKNVNGATLVLSFQKEFRWSPSNENLFIGRRKAP
jgi:hypothetical protein